MISRSKQIGFGMALSLYRLLGLVFSPAVVLVLAAFRRGRVRFAERLGWWRPPLGQPLWFHGASVGEVQGLIPILKLVRENLPDQRTLLTATSPTGLERGADYATATRILPLDILPCVWGALRSVSPRSLVISETELWPELMRAIFLRGTPVSIINGRISDYTFSWYRRLRGLFAPLLVRCSVVCVPDEVQRARFIDLGARPGAVHVTGHTKYDVLPRFAQPDQERLRSEIFSGLDASSRILVLGSVHPGEESWWLGAAEAAWRRGADLRVILVPRHLEKVGYFERCLSHLSLPYALRSACRSGGPSSARVVVFDTMGDLEVAYAAGDLAFVGATLVDIGGHNPFEPAMYGTPVCVGPYVSVIRPLVEEMRANNGLLLAESSEQVCTLVERLCAGDDLMRRVGLAGNEVWGRHRGAAKRVFERLLEVVG